MRLFAHNARAKFPAERTYGVTKRSSSLIEQWIVRKGWKEEASLQHVADSLGILKEDLSLYFRRKYRKCFLQWRKETRINDAKRRLLEEKDIPTALIGEEVGISDKSNFKRQFREITGMTPAQWRLKH